MTIPSVTDDIFLVRSMGCALPDIDNTQNIQKDVEVQHKDNGKILFHFNF